jgi:hypothetical protein
MAVTSDNKLLLCNSESSHPKVYIYKDYKTYEDEISLKLALKHQKSINQSNLTVFLLDMICKYIVYHTLAEYWKLL